MSAHGRFDDVLGANDRYASTFGDPRLEARAGRALVVVTCMDPRIDPSAMLGLRLGDAPVLRNAGARVTDEVFGALVVARHLLGVERIMVVAHTRCRMAVDDAEEIHDAIERAGGPDTRHLSFAVAGNQEATLSADVERLRSSPLVAGADVGGFVYDVDSGALTQVV